MKTNYKTSRKNNKLSDKKNVANVAGTAAVLLIMLVVLISIASFIVLYSPIANKYAGIIGLCIYFLGAFMCGFLFGKKTKSNGLLVGAFAGVFYIVFVVIAAFCICGEIAFSPVNNLILPLLLSSVGGVVGINLK